MKIKQRSNDKTGVSDILSCVILAIFAIMGAVYYASCYYQDYNLSFTKEDGFLFFIIISTIIVLGMVAILLSYMVFSLREEVRDLRKLTIDQHAEVLQASEENVRYTIESSKKIVEKIEENNRCN